MKYASSVYIWLGHKKIMSFTKSIINESTTDNLRKIYQQNLVIIPG